MIIQETAQQAELLRTEDVAALLKVAPATLVDWRHDQKGPRYYKMGREIRYKLSDLIEWERQALQPVEPKVL
jgi:predicted DNA-binding transcriptional regulator AlpA